MVSQTFFTIKVYTGGNTIERRARRRTPCAGVLAGCASSPFQGDQVPRIIAAPAVVAAAGTKPKKIEEFAGRVNSGHAAVSVARMTSPSGWLEPGQRPEFEEITVVLRGTVRVEHEGGVIDVQAGQAVVTSPGEWVRYSTPGHEGAEYVAVCLPAFSPATVHRDE
jgi:mannose-6-phosphate isomerase-like protein (cupin superfamily)